MTVIADADEHWLDLDGLAQVEEIFEEIAHPIEAATELWPGNWRDWTLDFR